MPPDGGEEPTEDGETSTDGGDDSVTESSDDDDDDDGDGGGGGSTALVVGGAVLALGAIAGGLWAAGAFSDDATLVGFDDGSGNADYPITIHLFGDAREGMHEVEMGVLARVRVIEW